MKASDWIKCSERLPKVQKSSKSVLLRSRFVPVWTIHEKWDRGRLVEFPDGKRYWDITAVVVDFDDVTHWMPIVGPEEE